MEDAEVDIHHPRSPMQNNIFYNIDTIGRGRRIAVRESCKCTAALDGSIP